MCFTQCYISPLNMSKQQDLGPVLNAFKGGKCQTSNQEKIGENPLLVPFLFTGPINLKKGMM